MENEEVKNENVEERPTEELEEIQPTNDNSKIEFPVAGIVIIGVLILCIIVCIIVICALQNK